jgi:hypothetical protein
MHIGRQFLAPQGWGSLAPEATYYLLSSRADLDAMTFAWYTQASDETTATGVLTVTFDGGAVADHEWAPAVIGSDGLPHPVSGAGADQMTEDLAQLATCADLEPLAR